MKKILVTIITIVLFAYIAKSDDLIKKEANQNTISLPNVDFSGSYGLKFRTVFNRDLLSSKIKIIQESPGAYHNIIWFRPITPVNKPGVDFFGTWISVFKNEKDRDFVQRDGRITEKELKFIDMSAPKFYAAVSIKSRKIYRIGVLIKYADSEMFTDAQKFYVAYFNQLAQLMDSSKTVVIESEKQDNILDISMMDTETEELAKVERAQSQEIVHESELDIVDSSTKNSDRDRYADQNKATYITGYGKQIRQ